jgi:hypothetical protein
MKHIWFGFGLAFSILLTAYSAGAQTPSQAPPPQAPSTAGDQSSLGAYARKIRKDPGTKARPKVFDNDNLPTDDKLSVVGPKPAANATIADNTDNNAAKPDDEQAKKQAAWKQWQDKLSGQKDQIDLASRELDVLQREYGLRAAAMYADAGDRLRNEGQWDKQDAEYKQKIADKQKAVDDAKQKLTDMQEEARKAGVPSSMID